MSDVSFRQVDIDKLDPDSIVNFQYEVEESGVSIEDIQQVSRTVTDAIHSGDFNKALKLAVQNPPYGTNEQAKDLALDVVLQVLSSMRISEIDSAVNGLNFNEQVVLVKYLYKASESQKGRKNGAVLLNWMDRTFLIGGQGVLSRYLTDRRVL